MAKKKTNRGGLGKGLDLLIPGAEPKEVEKESQFLKTSQIEPNKDQPRKKFDEEAIEELANSIRQYGIIQPIIVCKKDDYYQIIAGERRWRAAKKAGLREVPVVIKEYTDKEIAEISLIENIQREDLNPIEEAQSYRQLIDEYHLTQEDLAERIAKSRTEIANKMRLLKLPNEVQQMLAAGTLSAGHARALLALDTKKDQLKAAEIVLERSLSVRQTEDLVKKMKTPKKSKTAKKEKDEYAFVYKDLEKKLSDRLGTKVTINRKEKDKGKIEISYYSEEELDRLYGILNKGTK